MRLLALSILFAFLASCASAPAVNKSTTSQWRFPASYEQLSLTPTSWESLTPESKQFLADELYLKASRATLSGRYQEADQFWEPLMKLRGHEPFLRRQYGVNLIALGRLDDASRIFSSLYADSQRKDSTLGLVLAGVYAAENKKAEADKLYRHILRVEPGQQEACIYLSRSFVTLKKYSEAHQLLESCERKSKSGIFAYYQGKIELERKNEKKALKYFSHAVKLDPSYNQAVMGLGLILENQGKNLQALKVYQDYLDQFGEHYGILSRLVYIYGTGENRLKLIDAMERLSTLDPSDINLKVRLGVAYTDEHRLDDALATFKEILEEVPTSDKILYYLGALLVQSNRGEEALAYFARIPHDSSLYREGVMQSARLLSAMAADDFKEGSERSEKRYFSFVERAVSETADFAPTLATITASYYDDTNRGQEAIDALAPYADSKLLSSEDKYFLALLYDKNGLKNDCIALLRKVVAEDPENADIQNFLGYTLLENEGATDEAYTHISKAVSLKPEDGYVRDSLGWFYYVKGDYAQAAVHLARAWDLVKNDSIVAKHLALVHEKMGNMKKANFFLKQAIVYCKEEKEKQFLIHALEELEAKRLPASK